MKNSLELLLLELLFNKKTEAPPTKKKASGDLTVKQLVKVLKKTPELKKELEAALKALEPEKKDKDKLTLGQKYMLAVITGLLALPLYLLLMKQVFAAVSG